MPSQIRRPTNYRHLHEGTNAGKVTELVHVQPHDVHEHAVQVGVEPVQRHD